MKKVVIIILGIIAGNRFSSGQTIMIQAGESFSRLDWSINFPNTTISDLSNNPYFDKSVFIGMDYDDHHFYNLSSKVGFLQKGSQNIYINTEAFGYSVNQSIQPIIDYVSLNTTIEIKYPILTNIIPFIGVGPRIDYFIAHNSVLNGYSGLNAFSVGLILGGGIKYNLTRFQIGLRADYYLNFNDIYSNSSNYGTTYINDKTYLVNLFIGYKIK